MNNKILGDFGENIACEYLESEGFEVLDRNFRCEHGEIDVIASRHDVLCFVEVKTRRSLNYGRPAEAVSNEKRKRIRATASVYLDLLHEVGVFPRNIDFQVIEIVINRIERAF